MSDPAFKRAERVAQQIHRELGSLLVNGVRDPRVGFVTVTQVRLSDDLRNARVYVSIYGTQEQRLESIEGLQDAAGYLKRELSRKLKLRFIPNLKFALDTSLEDAARLDRLIACTDTEAPEKETIVPVQTARTELANATSALAATATRPTNKSARRGRKRRSR